MDYYMSQLKGSYVVVPVAAIIAYTIVKIYNSVKKNGSGNAESSNASAIKISLLVSAITLAVVYINTLKVEYSEEIISGPPTF